MTRLSDYLRAEQPDHTEPPCFYRPGATAWREARKPYAADVEPPVDAEDVVADELDEAEKLRAIHQLEE